MRIFMKVEGMLQLDPCSAGKAPGVYSLRRWARRPFGMNGRAHSRLMLPSPRIGISMIGGTDWIGGRIYVRNLLMCLASLPEIERPRVVILGEIGDDEISREILRLDFVEAGQQGQWQGRPRWQKSIAWRMRGLTQRLTGRDPWLEGIDVVYPQFKVSQQPVKDIYWIPDFQHQYLPHLFSEDQIVNRNQVHRQIACSNSVVVFSSEMAAKDFQKYYPSARAEAHILRFCSVPPADLPFEDPRQKFGLPQRFIYLANQFWTHKNHAQVIRALGLLKRKGIDVPLVCTGAMHDHRDPDYMAEINRLIDSSGVRPNVFLLGLIDRNTQLQLFRYACLVLQPSRFEGWSTVIEDARALGRPMLLSDFPVHREQLPRAHFFALDDDHGLARSLEEIWKDALPGPDLAAEELAKNNAGKLQMECARAFLAIVDSARWRGSELVG